MAARGTHEPARRVRLQPALSLAAVPDAIFRAEHPSASLAVEDREVAHRDPECPRLQAAVAALLDQDAIAGLGIPERIDSHAFSIADVPTRPSQLRSEGRPPHMVERQGAQFGRV